MQVTKLFLESRFNYLYQQACDIMKQYDPCGVCNGTCTRGRCGKQNFCCEGCKYLSDKGCTVEALACKLWVCEEAELLLPENVLDKLEQLTLLVWHWELEVFRGSKEESLEKALRILGGLTVDEVETKR